MIVCVCGGGGVFFTQLASLFVICAPAMVNVQLNQCGPHNQGVCHDCVCVFWFPKHRHNTHIHTQTHTQTLGYEDHTGLTGLHPNTDTTYTLT